ncbi:MAG: hypothetical protein QXS85_00500 [Acidilobaceae archaeon]
MKPEARVLLSRCSDDVCASVIARGRSFDSLILAESCAELCARLEREGYAGELRYALGDCTCGAPAPPGPVEAESFYEPLLVKLIGLAGRMKRARALQPS